MFDQTVIEQNPESPSQEIKQTAKNFHKTYVRVISVASFVTDIITPSRHRKCKAGCTTNSFRVNDKNCDFPE